MCHIYSNINKLTIKDKILQQWLIILKLESCKQPIKQWTFQVIFYNLTYAKSFLTNSKLLFYHFIWNRSIQAKLIPHYKNPDHKTNKNLYWQSYKILKECCAKSKILMFLYITGERKHYSHIFAKIYFNLNFCKF